MIKALLALVPWPWKLAGFGIVVAAIIGTGWYIHHAIYEKGYDAAIRDVAEKNAIAAERLREAVGRARACGARGGYWDQSVGVCRDQLENPFRDGR